MSEFEIADGCLIKYNGDNTDVVIPDSVTEIGEWAFYNCTKLKSVVLPANLTCINANAFTRCFNLSDIVIPDHVTVINDRAFYYCTGLKRVVIFEGVTRIGDEVFSRCSSLINIKIPDSVTSLGERVFNECFSLRKVILSKNLQELKYDTFKKCKILSDIVIPDSITRITPSVISYCDNLNKITIRDIDILPDDLKEFSLAGLPDVYFICSDEEKASYLAYMRENLSVTIRTAVKFPDLLKLLMDIDFITPDLTDDFIEEATNQQNVLATVMLIELKSNQNGF